ncbi:hypothetical protein QBC46DRAFT_460289 [Diplogelasinospora grovesii]|uniref:Adenosine deaminase domain-containing protein n=1 Tax=Diplogelasinospora grovesii TaxID=303347 RepID=A0AAN6N361_9PEZI|nr:hypothetical protein QBC46DRAFT_460289 [Diplogelasinospora grovesii]
MDFRALPKIELHAHLSGSISRQCLHEVWLRKKEAGETDLEDPLMVMPEGKHDYDLKAFFPLFSSYIYHLISCPWSLSHTTTRVLEDFASDGVVYLELRTTPRSLPGLSKAEYVQTILDAISSYHSRSPPPPLRAKLILSVDRRNSLPEALEAVSLARTFQSAGVVGVDLCGDPAAGPIDKFRPAFDQVKKIPGTGVTLHFAETACSGTGKELMELLSWKPERIGHVIHVPRNIRGQIINGFASEEAVKGDEGRKKKMGLELCLSCNVHAGMISGGFEAHHFGEWWKVEETIIALSTDDVGVFGSPLSNEYALVAEHFRLDRTEICALARGAIEVIFGGEEEKERLRGIMWTE